MRCFMKKVLVLFGGKSTEHYISCKSAKSIIENIDKSSYNVEIAGISLDGDWYKFNDDLSYLENGNWIDSRVLKIDNIVSFLKDFDVVFPITHGNYGEDGKLQGFFDLFNIKYVGSKTSSSVICFDKSLSKIVFKNLGIPQVPYLVVNSVFNIKTITEKIQFPMIVKPCCGGSSIGISKANNKKELVRAIKNALKYGNKVIIEKFINCRELECSVLGNKDFIVSAPGEIKSCNDFYDYDAKYINKSDTLVPDDIPNSIVQKITDYCKRIVDYIEISDYSRIDFFYDELNNSVFINEVNTIPGFTTISMFPKLIEFEGIDFKKLISILINYC